MSQRLNLPSLADPSLPPQPPPPSLPNPSPPWDLNMPPPPPVTFTSSPPLHLSSPSPSSLHLTSPSPLPRPSAATAAPNPNSPRGSHADSISPLSLGLCYGCTHDPRTCFDSFATCRDWVQHERHTHGALPVVWYCGEVCDVSFLGEADLEEHLQEEHDLWPAASVGALEHHAVGVRTQSYWCGFCREVRRSVDGEGGGGGGSDGVVEWEMERFRHLRDHFDGVGGGPRLTIADWEGMFVILSSTECD